MVKFTIFFFFFFKAHTVLEQHPLDRWVKAQLVPEWRIGKGRVWRREGIYWWPYQVYKGIISVHIQPNLSVKAHWSHNADEQWPDAYFESNAGLLSRSVTWPDSSWACILFAEGRTTRNWRQLQSKPGRTSLRKKPSIW